MKTFQDFQSSRREVTDLGEELRDSSLEDVPGYIYFNALFIEFVDPYAEIPEKYHLLIENSTTVSNDLEHLEKMLFEYACEAGYCDD